MFCTVVRCCWDFARVSCWNCPAACDWSVTFTRLHWRSDRGFFRRYLPKAHQWRRRKFVIFSWRHRAPMHCDDVRCCNAIIPSAFRLARQTGAPSLWSCVMLPAVDGSRSGRQISNCAPHFGAIMNCDLSTAIHQSCWQRFYICLCILQPSGK